MKLLSAGLLATSLCGMCARSSHRHMYNNGRRCDGLMVRDTFTNRQQHVTVLRVKLQFVDCISVTNVVLEKEKRSALL